MENIFEIIEEKIETVKIQDSSLSIKTTQEKFYEGLCLVSRAIARHPLQAVLNNIFLKTLEDNSLLIGATDLDMSLSVKIPCEIIKTGSVTIPSQKLQEILSKCNKGDVSIESSADAKISIKSARSKFEIKGLSAQDFPENILIDSTVDLSENNEDEERQEILNFKLPLNEIKNGCTSVNFAADRKETNSILNGICIEISEEANEIVATDGSRLSYYKALNVINEKKIKIVIPLRTINELIKMISDLDEEFINCSLINKSQIIFRTNNRRLFSNLMEGNYPNYKQLIPTDYSVKAVLNRQDFLIVLERVAILANERSRVIKLLFEEIGVLNVSANTPDLGEAKDQIDIESYQGNDFSIAFNVNLMIECLKNLNSEKIVLKMKESLKPIILEPVYNEEETKKINFEYLYLLMPVQFK